MKWGRRGEKRAGVSRLPCGAASVGGGSGPGDGKLHLPAGVGAGTQTLDRHGPRTASSGGEGPWGLVCSCLLQADGLSGLGEQRGQVHRERPGPVGCRTWLAPPHGEADGTLLIKLLERSCQLSACPPAMFQSLQLYSPKPSLNPGSPVRQPG